jgi:hypothetical protein
LGFRCEGFYELFAIRSTSSWRFIKIYLDCCFGVLFVAGFGLEFGDYGFVDAFGMSGFEVFVLLF